ncbi:MAG: SGNH/GDSL hydrolase family protein, partial [Ignavibacteriae bacterium]
MKHFPIFIITIALVVALLNGCTDSAPTGPVVGIGNATVTKYVSIGNSLTAGYQSGGLYKSAQLYSYPNLIAQQLTKAGATIGTFEQPYWPDPGTPDPLTGKASRYIIVSLVGPVIGPAGEAVTAGAPENAATVLRPYDNLGIPGIPLAGFMDTTGTYQSPPLGRDAILRWTTNAALGKSVFRQVGTLKAMGQTPDLVTFWLGANDVLGFATTGGTSPNAPTNTGIFGALYTQALDELRKLLPNAKIVVGNIPNVTAIPFFTTVNPLLAPSIPGPYYLRYQRHGVTGMALDSTKLTEANAPFVTLKGKAYAALLGTPSGQFWRDAAASLKLPVSAVIAAQGVTLDTTKPFGFHPQNPWPDALILDAAEVQSATDAVNNFNATIATVAASKGAVVVDFNSFFTNVKNNNGFIAFGEVYKTDYVS